MKFLALPAVSIRGRRVDKFAAALVLIGGIIFSLLVPSLVHREAGPDALTLWASYSRADNCDFWSPFSGSRSSYECTAYILRPTGINLDNAWIYGGLCNFLLIFLPITFFKRIPISIFLTMVAWTVIRGFFLENLTKEIIVGATVIAMLIGARGRFAPIAVISIAALYGIAIRPYWVLVAAAALGLIIVRKHLTRTRFFLLLPLLYVVIAIAISLVLGMTMTGFRQASNEMRILGEEGSRTLIMSVLNGTDIISQALDTSIIFFRLLFPIEVIILSGPHQLVFTATSSYTAVYLLRAFLSNHPVPRSALPCLAFSTSFLVVQAVFEPDFGSFARHFSMVAPIAFCGIGAWLREKDAPKSAAI